MEKTRDFSKFDGATDWQPGGGNVSPFAHGGICCGADAASFDGKVSLRDGAPTTTCPKVSLSKVIAPFEAA
jgi:hypothetical protein